MWTEEIEVEEAPLLPQLSCLPSRFFVELGLSKSIDHNPDLPYYENMKLKDAVMALENEFAETEQLYRKGLEIRRSVLGADYVDASLASANDFMMAFQHITTEWCWGYTWGRPGLDLKTRSLLNLAMLTALNRSNELKLHIRGALANGVTVDEIREVLLHATIYCGIPAGLDAFKASNEVLNAEGAFDRGKAAAQ